MIEHDFTPVIMKQLEKSFGDQGQSILHSSELLKYLNLKTRSASSGSKARSAFANHYAIYVLIEDYVKGKFHKNKNYRSYKGARYTDLLNRQRELPFGKKLQNHALNHRINQEFRKYFRDCEHMPILRDLKTNRYWINENLLRVKVGRKSYNIACVTIDIINAYVTQKTATFNAFIATCHEMKSIKKNDLTKVRGFVLNMLKPNVDARIFEIASFGILKEFYATQSVYWGWTQEDIGQEFLLLYKTGRCNANDGGIDFVMKPLGRFFQVTETADVKKYFLDIDKVQHYPITFVIKSCDSKKVLKNRIKEHAEQVYGVTKIVNRYMRCIEEIINIPTLVRKFNCIADENRTGSVIDEILKQSKVEFNHAETST